ncbi:MAG: M23 family metallopeptidase [Cyanobacteria bacterium P01_D01_bin.105]
MSVVWQRIFSYRAFPYISLLLASSLLFVGISEAVPHSFRQSAVARPPAAQAQIARISDPWVAASFPVDNFQQYTSPFGYRASGFHYGIDIAAPIGSSIHNWWEGYVLEVSDDSACGTSVVIQSGDWTHIYCHMQGYVTTDRNRRIFVDSGAGLRLAEGQQVPTAAPIGRIGMTGRTTGPHLHWGMKYRNEWVNPGEVLQAMQDGQRRASLPR